MIDNRAERGSRRQLVPATAERLREMIFARAAGEFIGALTQLAKTLGVGIVTVQQAARILEHEGLLEVRRGPGGGYYGRRPDLETLERSLTAYLRSNPASQIEVLEITSLLFNELCAAAATCDDDSKLAGLAAIGARIEACDDERQIGPLEQALQDVLFQMVERPLFELLTRVALHHSDGNSETPYRTGFGLKQWKESRRHILAAIMQQDSELAHFEANRRNRRTVMTMRNR